MKPCPQNRRLIAWLALDALDTQDAVALRDHLALCEGCRRYREELAQTIGGLTSAAVDSDLEVSESFHRRVAQKLQAVQSGSVLDRLAAWLDGAVRSWRLALAGIVAAAVLLFAVVATRRHPESSRPVPPTVQVVAASDSERELAPTMGNYQMIANQSLEKLSDLLIRQGNRSLPPTPRYTISSFESTQSSF